MGELEKSILDLPEKWRLYNFIFDWTGTISNNENLLMKVVNEILRIKKTGIELTIDQFKDEFPDYYMDFWTKNIPGITQDEQDELYNKHYDKFSKEIETKMYWSVKPTLKILNLMKKNLFAVSSDFGVTLYPEAEKYGIKEYFKEIICASRKKDEAINHLIEKYDLNPIETVIIGDAKSDMLAGKIAGIWRIATTTGYNRREQLEESEPDAIINNLTGLLKYALKKNPLPQTFTDF